MRTKSQLDVANNAHVSPSYLSLVESGKRKPSFDFLEAVAKELDIPLPSLVLLASDSSDYPAEHAKEIELLCAGIITSLMK